MNVVDLVLDMAAVYGKTVEFNQKAVVRLDDLFGCRVMNIDSKMMLDNPEWQYIYENTEILLEIDGRNFRSFSRTFISFLGR
jgi:hypothetical protein